jgi:hypothetical protein
MYYSYILAFAHDLVLCKFVCDKVGSFFEGLSFSTNYQQSHTFGVLSAQSSPLCVREITGPWVLVVVLGELAQRECTVSLK